MVRESVIVLIPTLRAIFKCLANGRQLSNCRFILRLGGSPQGIAEMHQVQTTLFSAMETVIEAGGTTVGCVETSI